MFIQLSLYYNDHWFILSERQTFSSVTIADMNPINGNVFFVIEIGGKRLFLLSERLSKFKVLS